MVILHIDMGYLNLDPTSMAGAAMSTARAPATRSRIGGRRSHEKCEFRRMRTRTPRRDAAASAATSGVCSPANQGLTLVHFSDQLKRFLWDRGCA
jgi:hypothetical protein